MLVIGFCVLTLTMFPVALSYGQDQPDSEVRRQFVSNRGSGGPRFGSIGKIAEPKTPARPASTVKPLGLGYTLLLRDASSHFVHASAKRLFKKGEAIRLLVESSHDGYLYVFHQQNNGTPRMIFPTWKVDQGRNRILEHVPFLIPAGAELVIGDEPATETLTLLVLSRPLTELPAGAELRGKEDVVVPADLFQRVSKPTLQRRDEHVVEGTPATIGGDKDGRTPGLKLRTYDESPDYIVLNRDPIETRLVLAVQVTHK